MAFQNLSNFIIIPSDAKPNDPQIILGLNAGQISVIPNELIVYYATVSETVVGGIITQLNATDYKYEALTVVGGSYRYVVGLVSNPGIVEELYRITPVGGHPHHIYGAIAGAQGAVTYDRDITVSFDNVGSSVGGLYIQADSRLVMANGAEVSYANESLVNVQSWNPIWSQSITNPTLGNGILSGRYLKQGNLCWIAIRLQIGSTTVLGTGNFSFTLPFNPGQIALQSINGWLIDASVAANRFTIAGRIRTATNTISNVIVSGLGDVTEAIPFAQANGDELVLQGWYITV